jgi:hypothetical protein
VGCYGANTYAKPLEFPVFQNRYKDVKTNDGDEFEETGEQKRPELYQKPLNGLIPGGYRTTLGESQEMSGKAKAFNAVAGISEALRYGADTYKGNREVWALFKEDDKRQAFYRATNMVDKVLGVRSQITERLEQLHNSQGNLRADLINYITDGTEPSNYGNAMSTEDKANYTKEVKNLGNGMMKSNGIPVRQ